MGDGASVEVVGPADTGFRGAWRHRQWRRLVSAYAVSATGDWFYDVALISWLLDRTGSAGWVAAAALAKILPSVFFGSLAGVLADRWDRRRLLVVGDLMRAALMVLVAVVIAADGEPAIVLAIVAVNALLGTVYRPAMAAATPQVVDEDSLAAANTIESVIGQVTWFVGPALGALVLVTASVEAAFLLDAATFLVSALLLVGLRLPPLADDVGGGPRQSFFAQFRDGVTTVRAAPDLIAILGLVAAVLFSFGFEQVLHVLVAKDRLGLGANGLGWMTAAIGVGGLAAAPFTLRVARTRRGGEALAFSAVLMGVPLALLAFVTQPWLAFALLPVEGIGNILFEVLAVTMLQRLSPPAALGRVFGLQSSAAASANLLGAVIAPILVATLSLEAALVVGGGVLITYALVALPALGRAGRRAQRTADDLEPRVAVLARLPFLQGAAPEVVESIAAAIKPERIDGGTVVLVEGGPADDLFVVRSGTLDVVAGGVKLNEVGADDVIGEIGVIHRRPRMATVIARTSAELWRIPGGAFLSAIERHDIMPDGLRRGIADRLAQTRVEVVG